MFLVLLITRPRWSHLVPHPMSGHLAYSKSMALMTLGSLGPALPVKQWGKFDFAVEEFTHHCRPILIYTIQCHVRLDLQLSGEYVRREPGFQCHLLTPPLVDEQLDRPRPYERSTYVLSFFYPVLIKKGFNRSAIVPRICYSPTYPQPRSPDSASPPSLAHKPRTKIPPVQEAKSLV